MGHYYSLPDAVLATDLASMLSLPLLAPTSTPSAPSTPATPTPTHHTPTTNSKAHGGGGALTIERSVAALQSLGIVLPPKLASSAHPDHKSEKDKPAPFDRKRYPFTHPLYFSAYSWQPHHDASPSLSHPPTLSYLSRSATGALPLFLLFLILPDVPPRLFQFELLAPCLGLW